jgi:hypothetical protein
MRRRAVALGCGDHAATLVMPPAAAAPACRGGAAEADPDAMLAMLDHLSQIVTQISKDRSRWPRCARAALLWTAGSAHPPRRAVLRLRWPQAGAE